MDEELRAELLRRVAADQEARHALDTGAMAAADGENLPWLQEAGDGRRFQPMAATVRPSQDAEAEGPRR